MKTLNYCVISAVSVLVAACGGGSSGSASSSATASSVEYSGYAVDDYVIGGTVTFKDIATAKVVATTTTGTLGQFSASLDPGINYLVTITGGVLDTDGDPATTNDQQSNPNTLMGMITPETVRTIQIFSAATTGIAIHANGDVAKYISNVNAINGVFPVMVATPSEVYQHLNTVLSVQNQLGFSHSVDEFSDDGALNGSGQLTARSVEAIAAAAAGAAAVKIKDPLLFSCIEDALEKQSPTLSDLESLTELNCTNRAIYSLEGIQQLRNLSSLVVRDNAISDATPLTGLRKLGYIDLADNRISTIQPLASAPFVEPPTVNVANNCIGSLPDTSNIETIQGGNQRSTCNKVVRDSLLFSASRKNADSILLIYRIPADTCALEYSTALSAQLTCDNRIHRMVLNVASSNADEYVRLKVDGQTHGVYLIESPKIYATINELLADFGLTKTGARWTYTVNGPFINDYLLDYTLTKVNAGSVQMSRLEPAPSVAPKYTVGTIGIDSTAGIYYSDVQGNTSSTLFPYMPAFDYGVVEPVFFPADARIGTTWQSNSGTTTNCETLNGGSDACTQYVHIESTILANTDRFSELCPSSPLAASLTLKPIKIKQTYTFVPFNPGTHKALASFTQYFWISPGVGFVAKQRVLSGVHVAPLLAANVCLQTVQGL